MSFLGGLFNSLGRSPSRAGTPQPGTPQPEERGGADPLAALRAAGAEVGAPLSAEAAAKLAEEIEAARAGERLAAERARRLERAVREFVPQQFVEMLGKTDITGLRLGDSAERKLTVMFCDVRNFTATCESLTPADTFDFVNSLLGILEPCIENAGGFVDKYVGDAIMALFPGSEKHPGGGDDAIAAGCAMLRALQRYNVGRSELGLEPVRIGIGINTGAAAVGTIGGGARKDVTVVSDAVNFASRLESATKVYGVPLLVSEATMYSLGKAPGVTTRYMDRLRVKGKAHPQSIYEVFETDPEPLRSAKIATRGTFEKGVGLYHMKEVDHALSLFRECLSRAPDDPAALAYVARCERTLAGGAWETTGELVAGTTPWTTEFVLGVEKMDEQHHTLLDHINELAPHVEDGDTASVSRILGFLAQYAKEHFGTEYGYMLRYRYPFTFEHVREHRSFIEYFLLMKAQIESGEHEPSFNVFQIQIFLVDWFTNHSTGTDRHLAQYLRRVWEGRDRPPTPGETETEVLVSHADDILGPEPEPAPGRPAVDTAGSLPTPPPGDREPTSPQSARLANPAAHRLTIGRRGSNVSDLAELTEERLRRQALDSPVHVGRRGSGTAELADVTEERLRRAGEGIGTGVLEPGEEVLD